MNRMTFRLEDALDTSDERQAADDAYTIAALKAVLAERERELLELKGPCFNTGCTLHYAHSGPCDSAETAARLDLDEHRNEETA